MTEQRIAKLKRILQESRFRLLTRAVDLAAPLTEMRFVAVNDIRKMSTNGNCIYFDAAWLEKLESWSLDYALCHQLMHIELDHIHRPVLYQGDRFHYACNVVVNSNLIRYGFTEERIPGIGELRHRTAFPCVEGSEVSAFEAFKMTPFDPLRLTLGQCRNVMFDTDAWWDRQNDRGETGIIVLSPEDPDPEDLIPSEKISGEIIQNLKKRKKKKQEHNFPISDEKSDEFGLPDDGERYLEYTTSRLSSPKEIITELRSLKVLDEQEIGDSGFCEHVIRKVDVIAKDWRELLNHFILDETKDYDFVPPDRRMTELDFFLPDFDDSHTLKQNVFFMVDISASVSNTELSMVAAEISAAIDQFGGVLQGTIGFFDSQVRSMAPITTSDDFLRNIPLCGAGTDYHCIFDYIFREKADALPSQIVVMTDGRGEHPDVEETAGIPVLWLLTNKRIRVPWGKAAYIRKV